MSNEIENSNARRKKADGGKSGQQMISFRCDTENLIFLNTRINKGRFLNELIARYRKEFPPEP